MLLVRESEDSRPTLSICEIDIDIIRKLYLTVGEHGTKVQGYVVISNIPECHLQIGTIRISRRERYLDAITRLSPLDTVDGSTGRVGEGCRKTDGDVNGGDQD